MTLARAGELTFIDFFYAQRSWRTQSLLAIRTSGNVQDPEQHRRLPAITGSCAARAAAGLSDTVLGDTVLGDTVLGDTVLGDTVAICCHSDFAGR